MSKRSAVVHGLLILLMLGMLAGGIAVRSQKADLYYPATVERSSFAFLEDRFRLVLSMDLLPNGNCGAGKGDLIALPYAYRVENGEAVSDKEALSALAERLAQQGASVAVYSVLGSYSGELYRIRDGELVKKPLYAKTGKDFSAALAAGMDRPGGTAFFALAALLLLYLLGFALFTVLKRAGLLSPVRVGAAEIPLSRKKYILSLAAACLLLLGTLAWLIAPNLYMLSRKRFEGGVFLASLLSLPFLACGALALLNLIAARKYRRWLNVLCLVVTAVLYGILLFSLVMMLLT